MTVSVALDVGAPVMVAALGNGNNIVKVFDAARRSRVDELRQHGYDALEQVDAAFVQLALEQLIELHDIEVRGTFHRRASGDGVVLRLIGPRCTAASLGDVLRNRLRGAPELICQVRGALGESPTDEVGYDEELERALVNVELLASGACQRYRSQPSQVASSFTGLITTTAAFPLPSAATSPGATTKTNTNTATNTTGLDPPFLMLERYDREQLGGW